MEFLSLKNVRKEYHTGSVTVPAVEGVSFDLKEGEFVVILGASGAGKTTLLNLLGGMDTATSGEIDLDGKRCRFQQTRTYRISPSRRGLCFSVLQLDAQPYRTRKRGNRRRNLRQSSRSEDSSRIGGTGRQIK